MELVEALPAGQQEPEAGHRHVPERAGLLRLPGQELDHAVGPGPEGEGLEGRLPPSRYTIYSSGGRDLYSMLIFLRTLRNPSLYVLVGLTGEDEEDSH